MAIPTDLHALVDKFAARIDALNLDGNAQEEYSTILCRLEDQADRAEPSRSIVDECLDFLKRFEARAA